MNNIFMTALKILHRHLMVITFNIGTFFTVYPIHLASKLFLTFVLLDFLHLTYQIITGHECKYNNIENLPMPLFCKELLNVDILFVLITFVRYSYCFYSILCKSVEWMINYLLTNNHILCITRSEQLCDEQRTLTFQNVLK